MIIFQPELFHELETLKEFIFELEKANLKYLVIDDFDFLNRTSLKLEKVDRDQNVVILHTLTLYRNIPKLINEFYPGTTFNFTDYSFSKLSSLVSRDWFLNKDFQIHTIGDIVQAFPHYEKFIRPDSGNKAFTGDVYTEEKFLREFKNGINEYSKFTIVSTPKEIDSEFRFHIFGREIVSQAFYTYSKEWSYDQRDWDIARAFMLGFLERYDICNLLNLPFIVLDVAVNQYGAGLVEHNCFNTSGIYPGSNVKGIIEALSKSLDDI